MHTLIPPGFVAAHIWCGKQHVLPRREGQAWTLTWPWKSVPGSQLLGVLGATHGSPVTALVSWVGSGMSSGNTGLGMKETVLSRREQSHSAPAGKLQVTADSEAAFT